MKLTTIISLFISTAAAIDVYNHEGEGCTGNYALCVGLPPDLCCGVTVNRGSVAFLGIPTNWNLELRAHSGGICRDFRFRQNHLGSSHACLSGYPISGGGYSFRSRKRDRLDSRDQCAATPEKCKGTVKPNRVGFTDGVKYDLTLLDDAAGDKILEIIGAGGLSTDVPGIYDAGKITE